MVVKKHVAKRGPGTGKSIVRNFRLKGHHWKTLTTIAKREGFRNQKDEPNEAEAVRFLIEKEQERMLKR